MMEDGYISFSVQLIQHGSSSVPEPDRAIAVFTHSPKITNKRADLRFAVDYREAVILLAST